MTVPTPDARCERLLRWASAHATSNCAMAYDLREAADRIQQQQATIERLSAALEKIDEWCCPMLCGNCRDNRRAARNALGKDAK